MSPYALLSLLLAYPDERLLAGRAELEAATEQLSRDPARDAIESFLASWADEPPAELQAEYVETFDFDKRCGLHLTYHVYGDQRRRGIELVRLKRRFALAGLALAEGELPDYLPALLEFAALAPDGQGASLLAEHHESIELVRSALHRRGSRYAVLLDAVAEALPPLTRAQAERVRRLAEEGPPTELVGLEPAAAVPEGAA